MCWCAVIRNCSLVLSLRCCTTCSFYRCGASQLQCGLPRLCAAAWDTVAHTRDPFVRMTWYSGLRYLRSKACRQYRGSVQTAVKSLSNSPLTYQGYRNETDKLTSKGQIQTQKVQKWKKCSNRKSATKKETCVTNRGCNKVQLTEGR